MITKLGKEIKEQKHTWATKNPGKAALAVGVPATVLAGLGIPLGLGTYAYLLHKGRKIDNTLANKKIEELKSK